MSNELGPLLPMDWVKYKGRAANSGLSTMLLEANPIFALRIPINNADPVMFECRVSCNKSNPRFALQAFVIKVEGNLFLTFLTKVKLDSKKTSQLFLFESRLRQKDQVLSNEDKEAFTPS